MADRTDTRAARKQRTKCFTGCWTCRFRRVKCDEGQPICRRCAQSGFQCEGYGVRLNWSRSSPGKPKDSDNTRPLKARRLITDTVERSVVASVVSSGPDQIMDDPGDYGETSGSQDDNVSDSLLPVPSPGRTSITPRWHQSPDGTKIPSDTSFRNDTTPRFSTGDTVTTASVPSYPSAFTSLVVLQTDPRSIDPLPLSKKADHAANTNLSQISHGGRVSHPSLGSLPAVNRGKEGHTTGQLSPAILSGDLFTASPASANREKQGHTTRQLSPIILDLVNGAFAASPAPPRQGHSPGSNSILQPPPRHLDSLSMPGDEKKLIHHWVTYTSGKLVLLDSSNNPMRTLMLPMALKGLTSSSHESNAGISIFHAVCACSAYNLYELGGRASDKYRALFVKHDHLAITHLRHNLDRVDDYVDQTFAMAIMAFFAVEAISGTPKRWRTHVSGGLAYLNRLYSRGADKQTLRDFHQHLVSLAIVCGCDVPSELKTFLDETEGLELAFPYYGASGSFLRAHDRMNFLMACKTTLDAQDLDSFELQLYLNFPTASQAPPGSTQSVNASAIIHHMAKAFYYASLVYFQRSIRQAPLESVQKLVESGIEELEAIETLSKGTAGSMVLWPSLVLAAECTAPDLQGRIRAWFQTKHKLGFRNVVVLEELASTLWSRRATFKSDIAWQDLMMEERFDVFRL